MQKPALCPIFLLRSRKCFNEGSALYPCKQKSPAFTCSRIPDQILLDQRVPWFKKIITKKQNKETKTKNSLNNLKSNCFLFCVVFPWVTCPAFSFPIVQIPDCSIEWKVRKGWRKKRKGGTAVKLISNFISYQVEYALAHKVTEQVNLEMWLPIEEKTGFHRQILVSLQHLKGSSNKCMYFLSLLIELLSGNSDSEDPRVSGKPGRTLSLSLFICPLLLMVVTKKNNPIVMQYFLLKKLT